MVNIVFQKTMGFNADDFNAVVDNIASILPDLIQRRYPQLAFHRCDFTVLRKNINIPYPYLTNETFVQYFGHKIDSIIHQVKKPVL
ncbi:MAG: hypothetical protein Q8K36_06550 [Alphaproteobacteria bacterium]|nr:hypothetical protein [Alphaproteobacteria bacterium]